jgi:GntR family transcriptional repressor for pyruvate dehydrogenase complex
MDSSVIDRVSKSLPRISRIDTDYSKRISENLREASAAENFQPVNRSVRNGSVDKMENASKPDPTHSAPALGTRVYQAIFEDLQKRIRQGDWLPGERLPSINQFARELNVSASSLREALRALQSIGLVKITHGSGVYITGSRPYTDLSGHFQDVGAGLIVALAETRRIVEPELAALAAERGTEEEFKKIERLACQMDQDAHVEKDFAELDVQFHSSIAQAARNPILYKMMAGVSDLFLESRRNILIDPQAMLRSARYHLLIVDALITRNGSQARLLMQAHMNSMLDDVLAMENRKQTQTRDKT